MRKPPLPLPPVTPQVKDPKKGFPWLLLTTALFVLWFSWNSLVPNLPGPGESAKLYSNQCQQDIRQVLLTAIRKADRSVYLVMFGLTDRAILSALQEKIEENIPTTIYYDMGGSSKIFKFLRGGQIHPIKNAGLMHQKIMVLNKSLVFIGSANMTSSSLRMHDNLMIGLHSPPLAKFIETHEPFSTGYFRTRVGKQEVELWLLPDPRGHALSHIRKKIRSAKHSLRIALFTLTHPHLVDEIIDAKERGVQVCVVMDKNSALGASAKAVERLAKANVQVFLNQGVQLLHHKFVYIDEETLVTGSANWTKAAFYKNSDCILTLHNLNSEQKQFMKNLWRQIRLNTQDPF